MAAAGLAALLLAPPEPEPDAAPARLAQIVPLEFGSWKNVTSAPTPVALNPDDPEAAVAIPFDDVLMRTYRNDDGRRVMLAIAYVRAQRQEAKIHRPEVCYVAQGYEVLGLRTVSFSGIAGRGAVAGKRMLARKRDALEAVSYWIRVGDRYTESGFDLRLALLTDGLRGKLLDGVLVRASLQVDDASAADDAHETAESFLADLSASVSPRGRSLLFGP
jgi:EpsI family protein